MSRALLPLRRSMGEKVDGRVSRNSLKNVLFLAAFVGVLGACEAESDAALPIRTGTWLADPTGELPEHFSDVGLYPRLPQLTVPDGVHSYAPAWPLWSNGSDKDRHVFIPGVVDTSDRTAWVFPVGTTFFKTFSYARADGSRQLVETRLLRRKADGWEYAAYQWNERGDDATKLELRTGVPVEVTNADGDTFEHRIPNRTECRTCHEASPSPVLGFTELQLADSPDATHGTELARLAEAHALSAAPSDAAHITADDESTREILGYFQGNCVHCHNGSAVAPASLDLRHEVAVANIVDVRTQSSATSSGLRVSPGDPESSVLFLAVSGETDNDDVKLMPPLGVELRDARAIERLREWIGNLDD